MKMVKNMTMTCSQDQFYVCDWKVAQALCLEINPCWVLSCHHLEILNNLNKELPHSPFVLSPAHYADSSACSEEIQSDMFISRKSHVMVNQGDKIEL